MTVDYVKSHRDTSAPLASNPIPHTRNALHVCELIAAICSTLTFHRSVDDILTKRNQKRDQIKTRHGEDIFDDEGTSGK